MLSLFCSLVYFGGWKVVRVIDTLEEGAPVRSCERERRSKRRFRIEQDVRYKMFFGQRIAETGVGKTMNISSAGVWFTTETMLTSGLPVELSMNWPVLLNGSCPMKLMIYGCVVRCNNKSAAMTIERYEFRTQGSQVFQQSGLPLLPPVEMRLTGSYGEVGTAFTQADPWRALWPPCGPPPAI